MILWVSLKIRQKKFWVSHHLRVHKQWRILIKFKRISRNFTMINGMLVIWINFCLTKPGRRLLVFLRILPVNKCFGRTSTGRALLFVSIYRVWRLLRRKVSSIHLSPKQRREPNLIYAIAILIFSPILSISLTLDRVSFSIQSEDLWISQKRIIR